MRSTDRSRRSNFDVTSFVFHAQSAETGERDEHEPERETGRAAARRQASGDDGRPVRDPYSAAGAHQVRGIVPVGGIGGETGHGGDQARTGHRSASEGGDRRAAGVRGPPRGAHTQTKTTSS